VLDHLLGDAELAQRDALRLVQRRQRQRQLQRPLRHDVGQAFVDAHSDLRRVRGGRELVVELVDFLAPRVGQVEGATVEVGLVRDVVERARDPVDRHDVRLTEVEPHEWHPLGDQPARALDRLEEVVRPVDLVHLAGPRVPNDDARPVHAPGHVRLLAHDPLGLELRAVIRRGQLLPLVEHLLAEAALVLARDRDRGDVVQALDLQRPRQLDRMCRAAHVSGGVLLGRCGHVVDRGEVEEVLDLPAQLRRLLGLHAQQRPA
jgi:hypothetical protein